MIRTKALEYLWKGARERGISLSYALDGLGEARDALHRAFGCHRSPIVQQFPHPVRLKAHYFRKPSAGRVLPGNLPQERRAPK